MPMVRHHAVREKCHLVAFDSGGQQVLERNVVRGCLEKLGAFRCPVHDMKDHTGRKYSSASCHEDLIDATVVPHVGFSRIASVLIK